tara:strand:+ start:5277 stop:5735 length:459 start_codon:yes stop_codon:yes gene_type:complete
MNICFWIPRLHKWQATSKRLEEIKGQVKTINDVRRLMRWHRWKKDGCKDWVPWPATYIATEDEEGFFHDDCDGAAAFAVVLFLCIGLASDVLSLRGMDTKGRRRGHAICVTADRRWMVSNDDTVELPPENWENFVLNYFKDEDGRNKYDRIL